MMRQPRSKFNYPLCFGANLLHDGVLFSVVSRSATQGRLLLYNSVDAMDPSEVIPFDPENNRCGDVWSIFVPEIQPGQLYHFQMDGPWEPQRGQRFDGKARLIDPYAKALAGDFQPSPDGIVRPPKCVVVNDQFDWSGDHHIRRPFSKSIIYELHVRGFTQSPSSRVSKPGTYLGLIEKIPYLKSLGITAVELMPIHEFPISETDGTTNPRPNYWGYDPLAFFAPHRGYAFSSEPGAQVQEFKEMVKTFHQEGLEVILDVVFNHTAEGNEKGATLSFKGLENSCYYMLDEQGCYKNYSGCGNTVNGNHPLTRGLIFDCLRYWVGNYHIDGFRFDLASILSRDRYGNLGVNPPLLEMIAEDPMLTDTKIIAEAWDAAGAYQVGSFGSKRWAEWNGRFRDDVRRFWRGDPAIRGAFATRLAGSSDLYEQSGRRPFSSVNFITSHDGFTMNDLVSFNYKHNEDNGEGNRDGDNNNFSCNYGTEGPTTDRSIAMIRKRQLKNFFMTLFFSQGVPMILAGDEICRTQQGNNNAYCQDSPISWFDWSLLEENQEMFRFCQTLIRFRHLEPALRQRTFLSGQPKQPGELPDVSWFDQRGGDVNWNDPCQNCLTSLLSALENDPVLFDSQRKTEKPSTLSDFNDEKMIRNDDLSSSEPSRFHILTMTNGSWKPQPFIFPTICSHPSFSWRLFIDTQALPPDDIYPNFDGPKPNLSTPIILPPHSGRIFLSDTSAPGS